MRTAFLRRSTGGASRPRALVCALLALVIGATTGDPGRRRGEDLPFAGLAELVSAGGDEARPVRARLTGGFAYAPYRAPPRGGRSPSPTVDVRLAAARLEKRLDERHDPSRLADYAAGALFIGQPSAAIDALLVGRRLDVRSARLASDLAAAYLARADARAPDASIDNIRALDAAIVATELDPSLVEAWFNRALAAEAALPPELAREAWTAYLRVDGRSGWASEARGRAAAIPVRSARDPALFLTQTFEDLPVTVRSAPQQAREALFDLVLPAWARALLGGRASDARLAAARAATIADTWSRVTGDPSPVDAIADMRRARRDHALAAAFIAYAAGRTAYVKEDLAGAERSFRTAATTGSRPLRCWAELQLAAIAIDRRDIVAAEAMLARLIQRTAASGYRAAHARARWLQGLVEHQSNRIDSALASYEQAASELADIGERENELAVMNAAADNLRLRGERQRSWQLVLDVLSHSGEITRPLRRYGTFFNAALFAADERLMHASLALQDQAVREALGASAPGVAVEALVTKARLLMRAENRPGARAALDQAHAALEKAGPDGYLEAAIAAAAGEITTDPEEAEMALSHALEFFTGAEPAMCARLRLLRGRARLARGDESGAAADFHAAIDEVEHRRAGIHSSALRVSYLDDASEVFSEMVALKMRQKRPREAFAYAERSLARTLLDVARAPLVAVEDVQRTLDRSTVAIEYKQLTGSLVCWVLTASDFTALEIPLPGEPIDGRIDRVRRELQAGSPGSASRELYDLLIAPVERYLSGASTIAIAGDGSIPRLPFAALRSSRHRYLVEDHAVTVVPSAAAFVALTARPRNAESSARALIVSDPDVSAALFPDLPHLPGAQAEARAVAAMYGDARLLAGKDATRRAVLAGLQDATVVHVAGHAVDNPERPELSSLVVTPERTGEVESGALRAHEISALSLPRSRLVVLAACDTAEGAVSRSEGPLGLARSFLHAGTPTVVAALWKIDDAASAELFRRFHRHYLDTRRPADALRSAQLEMLRSSDPSFSRPAAWAAIVSIGVPAGARPSVNSHQERISR